MTWRALLSVGRCAGPIPQTHQAMLQHRKLVEFVAAVVDEPLDEFGLDRSIRLFDRLADRLLELAAGQVRNQILGRAHRLRQAMEIGAITDEVGAHGDEDAHIFDPSAIGVEQDLDELGRFVALPRLFNSGAAAAEAGEAEAEELLELIDDKDERARAQAACFIERGPRS